MEKRDISEKILGLLEVFMNNPNVTMNLQNINMELSEMGHTPLSRSTFFRLIKKINLVQNAFEIKVSRGDVTERGYQLSIRFESGNSFSRLYERINSDLYDQTPPQRLFSDDDNYYFALDPLLSKISEAIKYKQTIDFDYFDLKTIRPTRYKDVTPIYIVVKPNKVWLYFTENQVAKKCNLFFTANMDLHEGKFDHISLQEFKSKFLNKHGYLKNEMKKLSVTLDSQEQHIAFHKFLAEQNFLRFYSSYRDKKTQKFMTEFKSLSEDQIRLFTYISNLIRKKDV